MLLGLHGICILHTNVLTDIRVARDTGYDALEIWVPKLERYLEAGHRLEDLPAALGPVQPATVNCLQDLAARGESPAGRVASAVGPGARRADRGDAGTSSRRCYTADGPTAPQPEGRQRFAAAGRCYSSSPMSRHRLLLEPCQRPQIPGARLHATFTTGC